MIHGTFAYVSSEDSKEAFPNNSPGHFTSILSQPTITRGCNLGLCEISIEPDRAVLSPKSENYDIYYVMVSECAGSNINSHKHPVLRMLSLKEFTCEKPVLRFQDLIYVPIKQEIISSLTVYLRKASHCCETTKAIPVSGTTRCTFKFS
jgi:hypothetical protein